jgi:hypothetical protein
MKQILPRRIYWFLAVAAILSLFIAQNVLAQTTGIKFSTMLVEVWPEYDRAEVLVIVRGELAADVEPPVLLTFTLPGHIDEMHAVAIDQNGSLVDANPDSMQIVHEGNFTKLTFASTSRRMQFEYYDPVILTKSGQSRDLDFEFTAPYEIDALTVEVQEPAEATGFSLSPAPSSSFTGNNGLQFNIIELTGVTADALITAQASYQRNTDALSVESLTQAPANIEPAAGNLSAPVGGETGSSSFFGSNSIGYILLGAGIILLLGTGGYWWWTNTRLNTQPVPARRAPASKANRRTKQTRRQETGSQPKSAPSRPLVSEQSDGFCYKCGTPLRRDSNFCHQCGAERRS